MIVFVANDPEARGGPAPRRIRPARARKRGATDFDFGALPAQKPWPANTPEFRVWQCREAVLRALAVWEKIAGPLVHWQGSPLRRKLSVDIDGGSDLNAYYDRAALRLFHHRDRATKRTRYFAASVDVVSHEAGHAFLDAVRPELWDSNYPEPNAFHEAFGDCVAILTALSDAPTRRALLAHDPTLAKANFVETLIESLANGLRDHDPKHNGAKPRHARNAYRWTLPSTLADDGGPGVLINEVHSFGQVFAGCFYDLIRNLFAMQRTRDSRALWECALRAGRLLVRGAVKAPHAPRFFQAVGRAMTLEDEALYRGRHHDAIRLAFRRHGILLGSVAAIAPRAALAGTLGKARGRARIPRDTLADLRAHLGVSPHAALRMRTFRLGGKPVAEAVHERAVALRGLSPKLANAVAIGTEPALIGEANRRAALLGPLPDRQATQDEVRAYVASLVRRGAIAWNAAAAKRRKPGTAAVAPTGGAPTHAIVRIDGRPTLKRLRFACGCCAVRRRRNASA